MKTIILSLLFLLTVNAQNIWYVDRDSPGSGGIYDGTSWATAWTKFNNVDYWGANSVGINWDLIEPGDTIYISGGSDSTTYIAVDEGAYGIVFRYTGVSTFVSGEQVVIAPAWHEGHNGEVYFTDYGTVKHILTLQNLSNIKLTGIKIVDNRIEGAASSMVRFGGWEGESGNDSLIVLENCHFISNGVRGILGFMGTANTLINSKLEHLPNDSPSDMDIITANSGAGGHIISGNTMIYRNSCDTTDAHRDVIQFSNFGLPGERRTNIIANNLIMIEEPSGNSWNALLYWYGQTDNYANLLIYNNIFVSWGTQTPVPLHTGRYIDSYTFGLTVLNNTFFTKSGGFHSNWQLDTMIFKNNLIVLDTTVTHFYNAANSSTEWSNYIKDIDYNYYAKSGGQGADDLFSYGGQVPYTWNQWRTQSGIDANSYTGNSSDITFSNAYDTAKTGYYTETGRGLGVNLWNDYPILRYDILGNERPQSGSWDIGALQHQGGGQSGNINVQGKIFLQGPFNSNSMSTHLAQNNLLPSSQPYNTSPWNYTGGEIIGSGSTSDFVDWVLVELRSSSNPAEVVGRRAAILRNDGVLLEPNGNSGVRFYDTQEGLYYIAVFHRNHLAVMSAQPVQLSSNNSQLYDFSTGLNKAYGSNPMKDLGNGIFGMYAGDGDANGGITIGDRVEVWQVQNGTMGYLKGDFNLDGGVNIIDANMFWSPNNGLMSQVP